MRSDAVEQKQPPRWLIEYKRRIHHVRAALAYSGGTHDEYDVAAGIAEGHFQMFCGGDSIAITEINEYPKAKDCHVFLAGGNLQELEVVTARIEQWARSIGCTRVTLAGRKGWERTFLAERNYRPRWYVMAKELIEEAHDGQGREQADHHAGEQNS